MIAALPGVYRPRSDSELLAEALRAEPIDGLRVLELCTGTGYVALSVASRCRQIVAADLSRRAALSARLNAAWRRARLEVRRGDLFAAVGPREFDVIVANPPYLPSPPGRSRRAARAWDGGDDGRAIVRRISEAAPRHLAAGGALYLLLSSLADVDACVEGLRAHGFDDVRVIAQREGPLGPIAMRRIAHLRALGHAPGASERLVVLRARRSPALAG